MPKWTTYVESTTTQEILTNSRKGYGAASVAVAITGADSFVIAWSGYGAGDDEGVFFQRYGPAV